ncbi:MAG: hypothetical protein R3B72_31350 [Polyangiaceae bacterium]
MSASSATLLALAAGLALVGCGSEKINPADSGATTSSSGSGGAGAGGAGGSSSSGPVTRVVEERNPWGGPVGNLLVDGDFEFSIVLEGSSPQSGWLVFVPGGQGYLQGETGGLCKSGLRCGKIQTGALLFGRATSALNAPMVASLWAKPAEGEGCNVIDHYYIYCSFQGLQLPVPAVSETPDADGWCQYRGQIPPQSQSICAIIEMPVQVGLATTALVDAATLLPDTTASTQNIRGFEPAPAARRERLREVSKKVRERMPLGGDVPFRGRPLRRD